MVVAVAGVELVVVDLADAHPVVDLAAAAAVTANEGQPILEFRDVEVDAAYVQTTRVEVAPPHHR